MTGKQGTRADYYVKAIERNYTAELDDDSQLCPRCGRGWVIPGTAGARSGICQRCHFKALAEAERLALEEVSAQREYDAARAKMRRIKKARTND